MSKTECMSPENVRKLVNYFPKTGVLTWKRRADSMFTDGESLSASIKANQWNARLSGKAAFGSSNGYRRGNIFGRACSAHSLAWVVYYGEWPSGQIDHINGNPSDNRIENLRVVSVVENNRNRKKPNTNKSGVIGVSRQGGRSTWLANIGDGKGGQIYLGSFKDKADAIAARKAAEVSLGFHPNHGRNAE